ncbi:MAG: hypothetical protein AB1641_08095 [Thermodesulfobacteriota bacterium]
MLKARRTRIGSLSVLLTLAILWPVSPTAADNVVITWCDCREFFVRDYELACRRTLRFKCPEGYFIVGLDQTMKCGRDRDITADVVWASEITCCRPCLKTR